MPWNPRGAVIVPIEPGFGGGIPGNDIRRSRASSAPGHAARATAWLRRAGVSLLRQDMSRGAIPADGTLGVRSRAARRIYAVPCRTQCPAHSAPCSTTRTARPNCESRCATAPSVIAPGGLHHDEHQDRRGHHRGRPVRPVPGLRAGAARDPCACRGHAPGDRRAVRGALPGQADLRHPRAPGGGRQRAGGAARGAAPPVRARPPSGRDGGEGSSASPTGRSRWRPPVEPGS